MELAKTTPQQRSEIYEDVRSLIVPGFLAHSFSLRDARFALRSLDRADWVLLQHRTHGLGEKHWRAWCVATAVWMVNGMVVMDNEEVVYDLYQSLVELPTHVIDTMYSILNGLMRRVNAASEIVEAFLYETESRSLWRTEGAAILHRRVSTRARRFDNPVISLWIYYNQMEDQRELEEHEWQMAKFVVGPHAPKSAKKLNAQDRKRVADMKRKREATLNRVFYEVKGLIPKKTDELDESGHRRRYQEVVMAESEEELRESMRRWVEGIKDDHDRVVDGVKSRIKHDVEKRKEEQRKRRQALETALEEEGINRTQFTPLVGEAGKKFIERMQARMPGASVVYDDHGHNSAYKKYIENNPEVGDLVVDDAGNIGSRTPVSADMLDVLTKPDEPERPDGQSLQEQIEKRRPTLDSFSDEGEEG
jgi:hypothetical protein